MLKMFRKLNYLPLLAGMAMLTFGPCNSQAQASPSATAAEPEIASQARATEAQVQIIVEQAHAAADEVRAAAMASHEEDMEIAAASVFTAQLADQEAQIAEAQRQVEEASRVMAEVAKALEAQRSGEQGNLVESRAELSRAHRALSEASREVARAHRQLARGESSQSRFRVINLGDRAVIGVLLGDSDERGVELSGVSPGGPAEQAGLKKGDVLTSIREVDLANQTGDSARDALVATMAEVNAGEEIRIGFVRDGKNQSLMVKAEQREPSSWQSLIRLPEPPPGAPDAPSIPGAPNAQAASGAPPEWTSHSSSARIVIKQIDESGAESSRVVVIDEQALADHIAEVEDRIDSFQYMFIDADGTRIEFEEDLNLDGDQFSRLGGEALHQADMWFGHSQTAGLELASLNPELGSYFKSDRGVLVLMVDEDNSYGLKTGDVILSVAGDDVNTPAELIRALRQFEPGAKFELQIKRERRDKTLQAHIPGKRLGSIHSQPRLLLHDPRM